jgi:hypothetical protein
MPPARTACCGAVIHPIQWQAHHSRPLGRLRSRKAKPYRGRFYVTSNSRAEHAIVSSSPRIEQHFIPICHVSSIAASGWLEAEPSGFLFFIPHPLFHFSASR